jgi:hypothetical protein
MRIKGKFTTKKHIAALVLTVIAAVALAIGGVVTTGAYFSDAKDGTISGDVGSIKITGSGGTGVNGLNLAFDNLMPGEPQTVTLNYQNTGSSKQDVWMVFNNVEALRALNNLGTYGEVHVVSDGVHRFDSANLNDNAATCGPFSPAGCWPLLRTVKVASNVAPGATGSADFTFGYAGKLSAQSPVGGGSWNSYPLSAPTANGLPYQLVGTQIGKTP